MVSAMKYSLALQVDQHEAEYMQTVLDLVWQRNSASGEFCLFDIKLHFNDRNEFTWNVYSPQTRRLYKLALWDKKAKELQVKCEDTQRITYKYSIREHIWITLGKGDAHSRGLTNSGFEEEGKCFWLFPQGNRFGELEKFSTVLFKVVALLGITYSPARKFFEETTVFCAVDICKNGWN